MSLVEHSLVFSSVLFSIGLLGFLIRQNLIFVFMSIELMLTASAVNFVALSANYVNLKGQILTIFIIMTAAAEAAVGVAILISTYRLKQTVYTGEWRSLSCRIQSGDVRHYAMGMVVGILLLAIIGALV
ncbi:MAG: NADH-quinone oxidoreductase subunit NuoK [bacterium]